MNIEEITRILTQKPKPIIIKLDPQQCYGTTQQYRDGAIMTLRYQGSIIAKIVLMTYEKSYVEVYGPGVPVIKYIPKISCRRRHPEQDWLLNKIIKDALKEGGYEIQ